MAKTTAATPSKSAYFKMLFRENPDWLKSASNDAILERWQADHPDEELTDGIRAVMSNVKSVVRKELGMRKRRRRRKSKATAPVAVAGSTNSAPTNVGRPRKQIALVLEVLETKIDGALAVARQYEHAGLGAAAKHLRMARNSVVRLI